MHGPKLLISIGSLGLLVACSTGSHFSSTSPASLCFRLSATPTHPHLLIPELGRLTSTPGTSHFSNLKGFEVQALGPDSLASLASLVWWSTRDSLVLVYDHYFVHVEARLARLRDSLTGDATYSSDVEGGPVPTWSISGRLMSCPE